MRLFGKIIQIFLRLFGVKRDTSGAQDGAEIDSSLSEIELSDSTDINSDEPVFTDPDSSVPTVIGDTVVGDTVGGDEPDHLVDVTAAHEPRYLWCLDNGHGKATPGKRSGLFADGTRLYEYEFNRGLNHILMDKLDEIGVQYYNVVPEIEGDTPLDIRVNRANSKFSDLPGGKIFLSIHANASVVSGWDPQNIRGIETWFYGGSWRGKKIASAFQRSLIGEMGWKDRFLKYHEPYSKSFYVLRKTSMPAILIENGFFTSREEAALLRSDEVREQLANAYVKAILQIEKNDISSVKTYEKIFKYS